MKARDVYIGCFYRYGNELEGAAKELKELGLVVETGPPFIFRVWKIHCRYPKENNVSLTLEDGNGVHLEWIVNGDDLTPLTPDEVTESTDFFEALAWQHIFYKKNEEAP